jgi:hypothetical protein
MSGLLFPRLSRERARAMIPVLRERSPEDLLSSAELLLEGHTFAPIGGRQVTEEEISALLLEAMRIATECGFPDDRREESRLRFDRRVARLLHDRMAITANQAADEEIWAHLTAGPLAALAAWRFPGLADERVLGRAPRNTFRRLWWRVEILGQIALDEERGLLEDETVQIMERTALAANPAVARALGDAFQRRLDASPDLRRMELMRDAMKRVNRLTPFILLESLPPDRLSTQLDLVFADATAAISGGDVPPVRPSRIDLVADEHTAEPLAPFVTAGPGISRDGKASEPESAGSSPGLAEPELRAAVASGGLATGGYSVESIPLGLLMQVLVEAVVARGTVGDDDLGAAIADTCGVEVPRARERLLRKLAWSARGRNQLVYDEATGRWSPGREQPSYDQRFGTWTFEQIAQRAAEMLTDDPDPFDRLLIQIAGEGRAPRVLASVVGTAINEARRNGGRG